MLVSLPCKPEGTKEKRQHEQAKQNLQASIEEKQRLESEFQNEINILEAKTNPITESLENIVITPTKTNIIVRFVGLIWSPNE